MITTSTAGVPSSAVWQALREEFAGQAVDQTLTAPAPLGATISVRLRPPVIEAHVHGSPWARALLRFRVRRRVRRAVVAASEVPWSADIEPDELSG